MTTALDHATSLYLHGIRDGQPRAAMAAHTGHRYTQHSTGVSDGKEGFVAFFDGFLARNPVRDIRVLRGWQDGRHVFLHVFQSLNHGEFEYVTADFFDSDEDERIIEHWDVIAELAGRTPSGHTEIDGATEVTDLHKTEENKALVRAMLETCRFRGARGDRLAEFVSAERYIEHSKDAPDGLDALAARVRAPDRAVNYEEIVLCAGSGSFVATLCRTDHAGVEHAQVDVFRVEDGLIVEHWETVEPVPEVHANSGKF